MSNVTLRFVQHKVAWTSLHLQYVAVIDDFVVGQQFKRGIAYDFPVNGDTLATDLAMGDGAADFQLLRDEFVESHEFVLPVTAEGI